MKYNIGKKVRVLAPEIVDSKLHTMKKVSLIGYIVDYTIDGIYTIKIDQEANSYPRETVLQTTNNIKGYRKRANEK